MKNLQLTFQSDIEDPRAELHRLFPDIIIGGVIRTGKQIQISIWCDDHYTPEDFLEYLCPAAVPPDTHP